MVSLRMTSHGINPKNLISCGLALTFCISKVQTIHFEMLKKNRKTVIWRPGRSSGAKWLEEPSGEKPWGGWRLWKKIQTLMTLSVVKISSRKKCYRFLRATAKDSKPSLIRRCAYFCYQLQRRPIKMRFFIKMRIVESLPSLDLEESYFSKRSLFFSENNFLFYHLKL